MGTRSWIALAAALTTVGCNNSATTGTKGSPTVAEKTEQTMADAKSQRILGLEQGWELAPRATYTASQRADEVTIKARGQHPASNYEAKLVMSPLRIWPPQWMLARHTTADMGATVIVPFEVTAKFKATERIAMVRITDAQGTQDVTVEQVAD